MSDTVLTVLLVIFLAHLGAFAVVGLRRREWYYALVTGLFTLLSAGLAMRLLAPEVAIGGWLLHEVLRYTAWPVAAVSLLWTIARIRARRRQSRQHVSQSSGVGR